ncbi:MAG: phosphoribosylamine--glycine ligase [Myxococcota bacterium]|nr:phosphoribosylamine--glycine ligase [Spirochaeta sp.]RPG04133.1 MAG: phosphoribosylamine--glycine ligase [Proteobacteria bacterium TMED72]
MKVLVVGSGGREHALVWKIAQSPEVDQVMVAPGSAAMAALAECHPEVAASDLDAIVRLAREGAADLVVVGPEDPLAAGLSDRLRAEGVAVFGPSAAAAQLEGSKSFAKAFMARHEIPTAAYRAFSDLDEALSYVHERGGRSVIKADGLAAGKGVAMCESPEDAERALREMMAEKRFGDAGNSVVIEDWLLGEEASYYAISDGENFVTLAAAQDHKRALDGDLGENTGGMGAYSPAPVIDEEVERRVLERVVRPAIAGMAADGHPYVGVLFVGLMIDSEGDPYVVEFNVRFGDPETQPLMVRMNDDLVPLLKAAAEGRLDPATKTNWGEAAICVVMASEGYPRDYPKGRAISGLEAAEVDDHVVVFHAGTRPSEDGSGYETSGGRVLGVTARGETVQAARDRAYAAVERIEFAGSQFRMDIAARALARD